MFVEQTKSSEITIAAITQAGTDLIDFIYFK